MTEPAARASAVFPNDLSALRGLSEWFRAFASAHGVEKARALDFELCVNEIVANVMQYAYDPRDTGREVTVTLERTGARLVAVIEDQGQPFDPLTAPPPRPARSLEELPTGGWGIALVRTLLDDVRYERRGGSNVLTLVSSGEKTRSGRAGD